MTVLCPQGHASESTDYCDQCGTPIAAASSAPPTDVLPAVEEIDTSTSAVSEPCQVCGAARSGDDRYCEACGHDFLAPPPAVTAWEVVVRPDRTQFERIAPSGLSFPANGGERTFRLDADEVRIGRSRAGATTAPEIDLAQPPEDPGVSRVHAVIERRGDGTYGIRDLGSTNGTTLNDDPRPIGADTATTLTDGDVIRLGAWTAIIVRAR
jgi:hypothetical protein